MHAGSSRRSTKQDGKRLRGRELDLDRLMGRLYAEDPAQPDAVSLMTIHGAKGLEFDHVFVVGVGLRGRADDPRLLNWLEMPREQGGDHLVMAPIRFRGDDEDAGDDAINLYLKQLHRERARAERARQAYVALTRARRSLHLFVHPRVKETDGVLEFGADANSLLHSLWPAIGADAASFHALGGDAEPAEGVAPAVTQTRQRLRRQPAPLVAARRCRWPTARSCRRAPSRTKSNSAGRARPRGASAPWCTRRWKDSGARDRRLRTSCRACARASSRGCRRWGSKRSAAKDGAEFALKALHATLADARGRWLFDRGHTAGAVGAGALGRAGRRSSSTR